MMLLAPTYNSTFSFEWIFHSVFPKAMKLCPGFPGEVRDTTRSTYSITYKPKYGNRGPHSAHEKCWK